MASKTFYYDYVNDNRCDSTGTRIARVDPVIAYQDTQSWTISVLDTSSSSVAPADLSDAATWRAAVNAGFEREDDPCCRTLNANIDTTSAADGEITVILDANTSSFAAAIGVDESVDGYFELAGYNASSQKVYYFRFGVSLINMLDPNSGDPPSAVSDYYTKTEADALLSVKEDTANKNQANGYAGLNVSGKIASDQLPAIAITETYSASDEASQLALDAQEGDICVRSDEGKTYIHNGGSAETIDDWTYLQCPTDAVQSVCGKTGVVTLSKSDIALDQVDNTSDLDKPISTLTQSALDAKNDISALDVIDQAETNSTLTWRDTYASGPAHGENTSSFSGNVLTRDGKKVVLIPYGSSYIGIYNIDTNTYTQGPSCGAQYMTGVLAPNATVIMAPFGNSYIGIYDPDANTYTQGPAHGEGSNAFSSSVLTPGGDVALIPRSSLYIGLYDPETNTYARGPAHGESGTFNGAALTLTGKIIMIPFTNSYIGIYDPDANTYTQGPAHGEGSNAFYSGTLLPNGKIFMTPFYSAYIGLYDPETNTYTRGPAHGEGDNAFKNAALAADGRVIMTPANSLYIGIYDYKTNTYTRGPAHGEGTSSVLSGSILTPNGTIVMSPWSSSYIGVFSTGLTSSLEACLSPYFNKF